MSNYYIGWPTLGNRSTLEESIISFAENAVSFGHKPEFIISSNLVCRNHIGFTSGISRNISKRFDIKTAVAGTENSNRFIEKLAAEFDPEILSYALINNKQLNQYGHNSNQLLLATAGNNYIQTDDDVFCLPGIVENELSRESGFSRKYLPAALLLYSSRDELLQNIKKTNTDVLSAHYALIGKKTDQGKLITLTTSGAYGDCGMGNPRSILGVRGKERLEKISSDTVYNKNKLAREVIRIPTQTITGPGAHLMGMNIGIYNTKLIPPFFPYGRSADLLFSVLTRIVYKNSNTAFLGFGLYHNPEEKRFFTKEDIQVYIPNMIDIIMAIILAYRPAEKTSSPRDRLLHIAETLIEFSTYKKTDFVEIVHNLWSQNLHIYTQELESLLIEYNRKPKEWASDVDILLDNIYELQREPALLFSKKYDTTSENVQKNLEKYGNLLKIWPDVHAHSVLLNQENRGLLNQ